MKKKKLAMLLAAALTFTQVAAVPVAAEDLTMYAVQEQESVLDDSAEEVTLDAEEELTVEEDEELLILDDTEVTVDTFQAQEEVTDDSAAEAVVESETELMVEGIEEVSLLSDEENNSEKREYGFDCRYDSISNGANGAMLPNSEMIISMRLFDDNGYIEDYELNIEKSQDFNEDFVEVSVDKNNPHNIVVKSKDKFGDCDGIFVKAIIDGNEVFREELIISVNQYKLSPETLQDNDNNPLNPEVNGSIDLSTAGIKLLKYVSEGQFNTITDTTKYTFDVSYNENDWTLKKVDGQTLPKMTRTTENSTWFDVFVEEDRGDEGKYELARIRYYFDSLTSGGNNDGDVWHGDDDSEEKSNYQLGLDFEESIGNGAMLPNSQMKLTTNLVDKTNDYNPIMDYKLEIISGSKIAEVTLGTDGKTLIINSKDKIGTGCCYVSVQVPDGNGGYQEVFKKDISFEVSQYMLTPQTLMDDDGNPLNPKKGEDINLSELGIKLRKYDLAGNYTELTDSSNYKIEVSTGVDEDGEAWFNYDPDGWTMTTNSNSTLPIMTRITENDTWFTVTAYEKVGDNAWNQIARLEYNFDSLSNGGNRDDEGNNSGYELQIDFDPSENGDMMPNSHLKVITSLYKIEDEIYMTDYKLEIIRQPQYGKAELIDGDKNLDITSGNEFGGSNIYVSVKLPDENDQYKEIFRKSIPFTVNKYKLSPATFANLKVGESIDLSKAGFKLMEYKAGEGLVQVNDPNVKFIIFSGEGEPGDIFSDYDESGWTLTPVEGQDLPIMTRTTSKLTYFAVMAWDETEPDGNKQLARTMYFFDPVEEHTHDWKEGKVTKEATCEETGIRVDTCVCGETEEVTIPAKGHTEVKDAAVAATCTTDGKTEGSHCSDCNTVLAAQQSIPAGHTEVKDAAVAATALATGKTEGSHCSVCGTVIKKQNTVAKLTPKVSLTAASLKMKTNQTTTKFKATGLAAGDYVTKVVSGNTKIVKVDKVKKDGTFKLVAGKKAGTTTVSIYLASGKKAAKSFKVTVQKGAVKTEKITTTTKNLTLKKGETYKKLASSVTVAPVTSKQKITYSSSDKKVVAVDSKGVITAKKAGKAEITIKSGNKKVVVTVTVPKVKTTKLTGVPEAKKIKRGKTFTIKAVAAPKNTDDKITYKSSDEKIVKVTKKGVVKGIKKGTATITVKSGSQTKTCKVTVK